jgi:preprotein translocase SecE subunit
MASETKTKDEKPMAADAVIAPGADDDDSRESRRPTPERSAPPRSGFFTIYKKGQGYWTRMGTAIAAALLDALVTWQLYIQMPRFFKDVERGQHVALIVAAVFAVLFGFFAWRLMNKPGNVDFLIATDSEMKKVNWTSKRELIGSTKVVIIFMFTIALILFLLDLLFNTVFYYLHILQQPWWKQIFGQPQ